MLKEDAELPMFQGWEKLEILCDLVKDGTFTQEEATRYLENKLLKLIPFIVRASLETEKDAGGK